MKRNFDTQFVTFDGKAILSGDLPLTLKRASVDALMVPFDDEKSISGEEKLRRYQLAVRINAGGDVDLKAEEVSLLKLVIGKAYAPIVVGPAFLALETEAAQ
jgi:hypothetical protein